GISNIVRAVAFTGKSMRSGREVSTCPEPSGTVREVLGFESAAPELQVKIRFARSCAYAGAVAVGCALVLATFSPAYRSADWLDQLRQARQWTFSDHHPPLMTMLWALLHRLWPGPSGIV